MDFRQLEYILKIAEEGNITRAAEKLYISQSALNQQLLKLERELGCQLFRRFRTDCQLTRAGELYIEGAKNALLQRKETYQKIDDEIRFQKYHLTIGLTPGRGFQMFTDIYPLFHKQFGNVSITPVEKNVQFQLEAIRRGELDLGFVTLGSSQRSSDSFITLGTEEMVVVIPRLHPLGRKAAPPGQPLATIDLRELQYEPFSLMYKTFTNRQICDAIFQKAGFTPNLLMEPSSTPSLVALVRSTLCCSILPRFYADPSDPQLACFALPDHPAWDLCICYRKNSYLSKGAKEFIRLAKEYWDQYLIPPEGIQPVDPKSDGTPEHWGRSQG